MGWVHFFVVDAVGRESLFEVKVKRDVVEWWLGRRCLAMLDRDKLQEWLHYRCEFVEGGELTLIHTRLGPFVEACGHLTPSPLPPVPFLALRDRLTP